MLMPQVNVHERITDDRISIFQRRIATVTVMGTGPFTEHEGNNDPLRALAETVSRDAYAEGESARS